MADTLARLVDETYDLARPGVVDRLMSIYAGSGAIVSATDGRITTSRDSLRLGIAGFWETIGRNMRNPRWVWTERQIEILSPTAAVMTGTYSIPHRAPSGEMHVVGGAWTAVFARRPEGWRIVHEHLSSNPAQAMAPADSEPLRAPPP
jgi:ketosteroid isomerase-like protein